MTKGIVKDLNDILEDNLKPKSFNICSIPCSLKVVVDWNLTAESYSEWTEWTKCNKHCYKSRVRNCVHTTICGTSMQEHYM
ncbi:hypothetical protein TNIN_26491 [Trichonephila inaurata madagascariensis]|uniref:Uncharacterized protein n=1 Tax=Trichonephila inaurata madagascariensis TaxID=2747483 RepID=A0A8X6YLA6_9ARAC|nr:hypothetical protein TNIN_26491 [Trichonephila inaurata madagascariensis]